MTRQLEVACMEVTSDHLVGGGPELQLSRGTQTLPRLIKKTPLVAQMSTKDISGYSMHFPMDGLVHALTKNIQLFRVKELLVSYIKFILPICSSGDTRSRL